jgi:hypothetical protein
MPGTRRRHEVWPVIRLMTYHFKKHFTREEARALLPQIRAWLDQVESFQVKLDVIQEGLDQPMATGQDLGGDLVNRSFKTSVALNEILRKFQDRGIIVKDLRRGLVDFPAIIGGREVFLCWEKGEDDVEFWHDMDSGYAGREPL